MIKVKLHMRFLFFRWVKIVFLEKLNELSFNKKKIEIDKEQIKFKKPFFVKIYKFQFENSKG